MFFLWLLLLLLLLLLLRMLLLPLFFLFLCWRVSIALIQLHPQHQLHCSCVTYVLYCLQVGKGEAVSLETIEQQLDPTIELTRLLEEEQYEEGFNKALCLGDVEMVVWLCKQLDTSAVFQSPCRLSQGMTSCITSNQ